MVFALFRPVISIKFPLRLLAQLVAYVSVALLTHSTPLGSQLHGTNVTINEAKIDEVAARIAPNVSSQITTTTTATIDNYSDVSIRCDTVTGRFGGDVIATVNTTSGETATASFSTRETWRN